MIAGTVLGSIGLWKLIQKRREAERKKKEEEEKRKRLQEMGLPADYGKYPSFSPNNPVFNEVKPAPSAPAQHPFPQMDYYDPELEKEMGFSTGNETGTQQQTRKKKKTMMGSGILDMYRPNLNKLDMNKLRLLFQNNRNNVRREKIMSRKVGGKRIRRSRTLYPFL